MKFFVHRCFWLACLLTACVSYAEDELKPASQEREFESQVEVAPQVALPMILVLKDRVDTKQARVYLKDVAKCQGLREICDEAYGVDLGPSPKPGRHKWLPKKDIQELVNQEFPKLMVSVNGADKVKLQSDYLEITSKKVTHALQEHLDAQLSGVENIRAKVSTARLMNSIKVRPSRFSIQFPSIVMGGNISVQKLHRRYLGHSLIDAWIVPEDELDARFSFKVQVKVVVEVYTPVAIESLPKEHVVHVNDFHYQWLPIRRKHGSLVQNIEKYEGWLIKSQIASGEPLSVSKLQKPKMVKRGEIVELLIKKDNMALSTKAKALADGAYDDSIKVYFDQTKRKLQATVVGRSKVEVKL